MRRHRFGTFTGGIDLRAHKDSTRDERITPIRPPGVLRVPIDPAGGGRAESLVQPGQAVRAGQRIAMAGGMPIFAPADGVVAGIGTCVLAGGEAEGKVSPAVAIGQPASPEPWAGAPGFDWRSASPAELLGRLTAGGVTTCTAAPAALADVCAVAPPGAVDTLIADGMDNQPYLTAGHRILCEFGPEAMAGVAILRAILGAKRAALAVDSRRTDSYRTLVEPAEGLGIRTVALMHKYPVGHPIMLTHVLTGRKVRPGRTPPSVGVVVVHVAAALAAYHAVACGRPATQTVVTVAGRDVERPGNYLTPFGTPVDHLLAVAGGPADSPDLCHNGPMTGTALPAGAVVGPGTAAVLSLPPQRSRRATTCMRCGWCMDCCPVRLAVAPLNDMYELRQLDRAARYDVTACLGCGVCSYVCPAHLPLAHRVGQLKQTVLARTERKPQA